MEQQALNGIAGSNFGNSYLVEKKFEIMLDNASKRLMAEISSLRGAVSSLQSELVELKRGREHASMQNAPQAPVQSVLQTPSVQRAETPLRPRYGDYNSEDVAVEKMFYFGNKR